MEVDISPLGDELQAIVSSTCVAPIIYVSTILKAIPDTKENDTQQEEQHRALYGTTPEGNMQRRDAPLGSCKGQEWGLELHLSLTHLRDLSV